MFKSLKELFLQINQTDSGPIIGLDLAMTVLLYEVAAADFTIDNQEEIAIKNLIADSFTLNDEQANKLLAEAKNHQHNAISLQQFTQILREALDRPSRVNFIHSLWQVAHSDDNVDVNEEHIIRKISDLLHLNHSDYIRTKLKVVDNNS